MWHLWGLSDIYVELVSVKNFLFGQDKLLNVNKPYMNIGEASVWSNNEELP